MEGRTLFMGKNHLAEMFLNQEWMYKERCIQKISWVCLDFHVEIMQ